MADLAHCFARCADTEVEIQGSRGVDRVDAGPQREHLPGDKHSLKVAWYDEAFLLVCTIMYIADVTTDLLVSTKYYRNGDYTWFSLTLACIVGASIVMNIFSLKWFYDDTAEQVDKTIMIVVHLFQLGPLQRYWDAFKSGRKSHKRENSSEYYDMCIEQWRDITMLRLFEAFIESAPQLILQLYILAYKREFDKESDWLTALSACCSLLSLSTSIVSYSKALRDAQANKGKMTWWAFGCQCVWRLSMVASRIITLVLFASVYQSWILLVIGCHWVAMAIWVYRQGTSFCGGKKHLERFFSSVIGFVYIFCFFNTKDGFTRKRLVIFYFVIFLEDFVLMGLWLPYRHEYGIIFFIAVSWVFGGFFLGVFAMFLYYQFYHPSLPVQGIIWHTNHDVPSANEIVYRYLCCNYCCHLRYHKDDLMEPSMGSEIVIDIPVSQGSVGESLSRSRESTSPPFESEVFYHKPSELQRRHSLEKLRRKQLQAERTQGKEHLENGVTNGTCSHGSPTSQEFELEIRPVNSFNRSGHEMDIKLDNAKIDYANGVYSQTSQDYYNDIETTPQVGGPSSSELGLKADDNKLGLSCGVNVSGTANLKRQYENKLQCGTDEKRDAEVMKTNVIPTTDCGLAYAGGGVETAASVKDSGKCDDGVHCGTDDEETRTNWVKTRTCDDGVHCGTDDEEETRTSDKNGVYDDKVHCGADEKETRTSVVKTKICDNGVHCREDDDNEETRTSLLKTKICDDGVHCGTDDEEETKTGVVKNGVYDDGVHCGVDEEEKTITSVVKRKTCDDGVHCGTDDEDDTKSSKTKFSSHRAHCENGMGTRANRRTNGKCKDGAHCGTDDEDDTKTSKTKFSDHGVHCENGMGTRANTRTNGKCEDGVHCGTDDEEETRTGVVKTKISSDKLHVRKTDRKKNNSDTASRKVNTYPTDNDYEFDTEHNSATSRQESGEASPNHVDEKVNQNCESRLSVPSSFSLGFNHRYSIVSDCISLSSSSSDTTEEVFCEHDKDRQTTSSCKDDSDDYTLNNKLLGASSRRLSPRRNRNPNRISFPNFVASNHLNHGRFSSLRVSREDLKDEQFAGEVKKADRTDNKYWTFLQSLRPRKFGSVRERMQELGRSPTHEQSSSELKRNLSNNCVAFRDSKHDSNTTKSPGGVKGSTI